MALIGLVGPCCTKSIEAVLLFGTGSSIDQATIKIDESGVRVVTLSTSPTTLQVGDDGSEPAHTKARSGPMDFWHLPGCWGPQAVNVARAFELESTLCLLLHPFFYCRQTIRNEALLG